jgi:UDP-N-acetylglucosamine--N-acetylmuramyl-(pentapeptide) pyrophosphoryl-undecaprenol N-acetylglucosamine transferase
MAKMKSLLSLGVGYLQARSLLKRLQPEAVVGFGGYAALPTVMAAAHRHLRVILHEQNAVLGRTNRLLAPKADVVATSFPEVRGLREADRDKAVLTGNPVRGQIAALGRKPYAVANAHGHLRLLVTGGSQGARVFNDLVPRAVALLPEPLRRRLKISQQVRGTDLEAVRQAYEGTHVQVELQSFFEDLPDRLKSAHLVICRSGASTVTELSTAGRPAILVPYPFAADDHQTANAQAFAEGGGGWVMPQSTLTPEALAERLNEVLADTATLTGAANAARAFGQPDSAARLADLVTGVHRTNGDEKGHVDGNRNGKEAAA